MIAARAARSLGENEKALTLLGDVGVAKRGPIIARLLRAQLLLANGQFEEARGIARDVMEMYPHDKRAQAILDRADIK